MKHYCKEYYSQYTNINSFINKLNEEENLILSINIFNTKEKKRNNIKVK